MKDLDPAVSIIKEFEGLRLKAYICPAGLPTIGYGTTRYPSGEKVKLGDEISIEQATEYLYSDLKVFVKAVHDMIEVPLSNNQFCALVCFCYNVGPMNLKRSTLLRKLNAELPKASVSIEFMKWVKAGGIVLGGLVRRREAERALFMTPDQPEPIQLA
jgi:lysozyme